MLRMILVCGALLAPACYTQPAEITRGTAERNARAWCDNMGLGCTGASCSAADSDGDRYVSCTVATHEGLQAIECGYDLVVTPLEGQNTGCRIALPKTRVTNNNAITVGD